MIAAVVLVLVSGCSYGPAHHAQYKWADLNGKPATSLTWFHMNDGQHGWGLAGSHIQRTTDGGQTWVNVTPPGTMVQDSTAISVIDSKRIAAVVRSVAAKAKQVQYSLAITSDGGSSWSTYRLPVTGMQHFLLGFTSVTSGYVLDDQGVIMGKPEFTLYRFSHGKLTLAGGEEQGKLADTIKNVIPVPGGITGFSATADDIAWITYSGTYLHSLPASKMSLLVTRDGGQSWKQPMVALPEGAQRQNVRFNPPGASGDDSVLTAMSCDSKRCTLAIYREQGQGGPLMLQSATTTQAATSPGTSISYFTGEYDEWMTQVASAGLYLSTDDGQNWRRVASGSLWPHVKQVQFTSRDQGWVLVNIPGGSGHALMTSGDGGRTWHVVGQ